MGTAAAKSVGQDLEHLFKLRLEDAKKRLDTATDRVKETGDADGNGGTPPAESESHQNAICEYTEAIAEYVMVSKIYQDLVLRGLQSQTGAKRRSSRRNRMAATAAAFSL
jgi:hypothetical protein